MAKKQRPEPRGATPLPRQKVARQWQWSLPSLPWHWLALPVLLLALVYGTQWLVQRWPLTAIEVTGRMSAWDAGRIGQELLWVKDESFFSLDVEQVHQQLQALPLVMQVSVRKRWPGTLDIHLTEDVPVAVWNGSELLSASGMLSRIPEGLDVSTLTGMEGPGQQAAQAVRYFRRIQQVLNERAVRVEKLSISATGAVQARLSNGWSVEFGRQYFEERVLRLEKLLLQLPQEKVATVDLRYGKGAAISWRREQEMG